MEIKIKIYGVRISKIGYNHYRIIYDIYIYDGLTNRREIYRIIVTQLTIRRLTC